MTNTTNQNQAELNFGEQDDSVQTVPYNKPEKNQQEQTQPYTLVDFQISSDAFNDISGGSSKLTSLDIKNQIKLMKEEVIETEDAYAVNDLTEILDGCIDTLYTSLGLLQKLKNLGIDTEGALKKVALDNLSKFPKSADEMNASVQAYARSGVEVDALYNTDHGVYVLKDKSDKVKKPLSFVSTDLSAFTLGIILVKKGSNNV